MLLALDLSGSKKGSDGTFFLMKSKMEVRRLFVSQSSINRCRHKMLEMGVWKATGGKRAHGSKEYHWDFTALEVASNGLPIESCPLSVVEALKPRRDRIKPKTLRLLKPQKYVLTFIRTNGPDGFKRKELAQHILAREAQYNQGPGTRKRNALLEQGLNPSDHLPNDILLGKLKKGLELTDAEKRLLRSVEKRGDRIISTLAHRGFIERLEVQRGRNGFLKYQATKTMENHLTPPAEEIGALIDEGDALPIT